MEHIFLSFAVAFILAPFSYYMGQLANFLKLPKITGYLISGIICGPSILGILSKETVLELSIVEGACLSIIGLASGVELQISEILKHRKQVVGITLGVCISTWIICYVTFMSTCWMISFKTGLTPNLVKAISSLGATLMLARSPASAIAVLKEMEGKGPFSSLVLAVIILKDVVVIIAYAVNIELVGAMLAADHVIAPLTPTAAKLLAAPLGSPVAALSAATTTTATAAATTTASGALIATTAAAAAAAASPSVFVTLLLPLRSVFVSVTLGTCGGILLSHVVMNPLSILVPTFIPGLSSPAGIFK